MCYLSLQKTLDDLQAEEDKVNHLTKSNSKLNTQIHEVRPQDWANSAAGGPGPSGALGPQTDLGNGTDTSPGEVRAFLMSKLRNQSGSLLHCA